VDHFSSLNMEIKKNRECENTIFKNLISCKFCCFFLFTSFVLSYRSYSFYQYFRLDSDAHKYFLPRFFFLMSLGFTFLDQLSTLSLFSKKSPDLNLTFCPLIFDTLNADHLLHLVSV
jgi:magnesium-transporting ATPase (P-type)